METGDDGTVLRLTETLHDVMQPGKGEGSGREPRRVVSADVPSGLDQAKPAEAPAATPAIAPFPSPRARFRLKLACIRPPELTAA